MSIYSDVRKGIRAGALKALGGYTNPQVIFSHSNGTEPSESYLVISIQSINPQGRQSVSTLTDTQSRLTITASYEVFVQFSFIGSMSGEMSQSFTQRLGGNPIIGEEFQRNKLGFLRKSSIRRAPQKRDTKWVEYHNMDAYFSYSVVTQEVVDVVEGVVMSSPQTGEFTIPPDLIINP